MQITGQATILKDDRGIYKLNIVANEINKETGEQEKAFMKINVGFLKGVEVKNKTKINIKNGFLSFFKVDTEEVNEDGKPIYKQFPKIIVMDFEVLEEGTDEVYHSQNNSNNKKSNNQYSKDFENYNEYDNSELPF